MSSTSTRLDDRAVTALRVGSSGLTRGEMAGGEGRTSLDSAMLTAWMSLSSDPTTADLERRQIHNVGPPFYFVKSITYKALLFTLLNQ